MQRALLAFLVCPYDREASLDLAASSPPTDDGEISEGTLVCSACARCYPILDTIVCVLPDDLRDVAREIATFTSQSAGETYREHVRRWKGDDFAALTEFESNEARQKVSEMRKRDEEAPDYHSFVEDFRARIEPERVASRSRVQPGDVVLDLGAGIGRMVTTYQGRCRLAIASDFSFESLQVLRRLHSAAGQVPHLLQADASHLPLRDEAFDVVLCISMIQHVPTERARQMAIHEMARVLRPFGRIVLLTHNYNLSRRLGLHNTGAAGKEGCQSDGKIYYLTFTVQELGRLMSERFRLDEMCGIVSYWPFVRRIPFPVRRGLDRMLERRPISRFTGESLLAVGHKR